MPSLEYWFKKLTNAKSDVPESEALLWKPVNALSGVLV